MVGKMQIRNTMRYGLIQVTASVTKRTKKIVGKLVEKTDPLCTVGESKSVSHSVRSDSATPWTVALQAPLPMEFSRPEYWSG